MVSPTPARDGAPLLPVINRHAAPLSSGSDLEHALARPSGLPRIAMVATHGYVTANPPAGAADTGAQLGYVLELAQRLALLGYQVDIWTRRFSTLAEIEPVTERVRIVRVPCGGPDFLPKEYLCDHLAEWNEHALQFIEQHSLQYAFLHSHHWDAGLAAQHLSHVLGIPHVHTPHSLGLWKQRQTEADFPGRNAELERRHNFKRRIEEERRIYADCDIVVATTPPQCDLIVRDYGVPASKVRLIPPGYDEHRFSPATDSNRMAIRQRLGLQGKVVLATGRPSRNRGYDLLIDAFALVAQREPKAVLHLAAIAADLNQAEQKLLAEYRARAARSEFATRIQFGPLIAEANLADFYRAADVFVLCNRYEPLGMSAIESMASGTPTVVTVHGGLYRMLSFGPHAVFADPFDREDLGIAIARILKHPRLRVRLARMGAHKARTSFTWTGIAHQVVAAAKHRTLAALAIDDGDANHRWSDTD
jgi:mannosylfructose-phosphate synthase